MEKTPIKQNQIWKNINGTYMAIIQTSQFDIYYVVSTNIDKIRRKLREKQYDSTTNKAAVANWIKNTNATLVRVSTTLKLEKTAR